MHSRRCMLEGLNRRQGENGGCAWDGNHSLLGKPCPWMWSSEVWTIFIRSSSIIWPHASGKTDNEGSDNRNLLYNSVQKRPKWGTYLKHLHEDNYPGRSVQWLTADERWMEVCTMSLARASFHSYKIWMKDFHNLLRKKPFSLFMLLGCSSISIIPLMVNLAIILVFCSWMQWPSLCYVKLRQTTYCDGRDMCWWYSGGTIVPNQHPVCPANTTLAENGEYTWRL